jgi:Zn-dependent peptidase ImmA (M78 family)
MRSWVQTALIVATVAGVGCSERARAVQREAELQQVVDQMMAPVERATGLTFKRHPTVLQRSRSQVRDYVVHKSDHDLPPSELVGMQAAYRRFRLLPDSIDLRRTVIDLLTEQVAGYFDPDSNALFIPTDIDPAQARLVVSHELVHALQAQYVDLDSVIHQAHQNDRRSAAQAILEGQATLAQILVLMPEQNVDSLPDFWELRDALGKQQAQMTVFASAPLWLRESLIFPYLGGAEFVRRFRHVHPAKQPFGALMPVSTEQILHLDRYEAGDRPQRVEFVRPLPDTVLYDNDLGEFETRLLLEQLLHNSAQAAALATGWGGDRYQVYGATGDALVWYCVWDDARGADRFADGLKRGWTAGPRDANPRRTEVTRLVLGGLPGVRFVDAPQDWAGWKRLPTVRVIHPSPLKAK